MSDNTNWQGHHSSGSDSSGGQLAGGPPASALAPIKMVVTTMAGGLLMIALALSFVVQDNEQNLVHLGVGVALVAVGALLGRTLGTRVPALQVGDPQPQQTALARLRSSTLVAAVVADAAAVLWVALVFVLEVSVIFTVVVLLLGAAGVAWAAFPGGSRLRAVESALDSGGVPSQLTAPPAG